MRVLIPQINRLKGRIVWIQEGLLDSTLKLRVGEALEFEGQRQYPRQRHTPDPPGTTVGGRDTFGRHLSRGT